jgi:hypothetical protein
LGNNTKIGSSPISGAKSTKRFFIGLVLEGENCSPSFLCLFLYIIINLKNFKLMAKHTKTFKIGEYAKGGIITVEIVGKIIFVIGKNWDVSKGTSKGSNQSGAKEFTRGSVVATEENAYRKLDDFLNDLTTSYYSDVIIKWIESKV